MGLQGCHSGGLWTRGMAGVLSSCGAMAGDAGVLGRQEEALEAAELWSSGSLDYRVQT